VVVNLAPSLSLATNMIRTFASQVPKMAGAACMHSGSMQQNTTAEPEPPRRINRRLEVDLQELRMMQVWEDVTLIDVRQPTELLTQEQIPGSLNIPLGNLKAVFQLSDQQWLERFQQSKPSKNDKAIVFYGRGNIASSSAVEIAHRMGYKKSRQYLGGWEDYVAQNNLPFYKAAPPQPQQEQPNETFSYYEPQLYYYPK